MTDQSAPHEVKENINDPDSALLSSRYIEENKDEATSETDVTADVIVQDERILETDQAKKTFTSGQSVKGLTSDEKSSQERKAAGEEEDEQYQGPGKEII